MKVLNLKNGKLEEYNDSYAARLIEQGVAKLPEKPAQAAKTSDSAKGKADKAGGK